MRGNLRFGMQSSDYPVIRKKARLPYTRRDWRLKKCVLKDTRWLDAREAAKILSVSEDWLYRNARKLRFTRKLGPKMVRFSYQGLIKWRATRKLS